MPFGILEDRHMELVPGTAFMFDQPDLPPEYANIPKERLKHGTGRYADLVLIPQPTDDPNDPLNWPLWKKDGILLIVGLSSSVVGAFGPMLSPGFVEVSGDLGISINTLSQATAWLILTIGLSLFIANPLAKSYGKRPVYIVAIIIMFVGSVWGALATSYSSFLGSRILSGFGMAPYEVIIQCTIGDLYFVHQRATRIALWNLFLLCGINGGSLIAGYIIEDIGYKWTFGICAIFFGVFMFLVFFFVPETAYRRQNLAVPPQHAEKTTDEEKPGLASSESDHAEDSSITPSRPAKKRTYLQSLRIYTGRYTDAPFWWVFARPFVMFFYPAVFFSFLLYGTTLTFIVVFSVVNASIFTFPPYNFTVSQTGLISLSPFILTIIGELISGPLNDRIGLTLARRNRGIYEPEFRLPLMIVVVILGTAGFFGFGATVHYQTHWSGPVLTFGLANMSLAFASTCVFGYIIDSYEKLSEEAFVAINSRNLLTFGLTYFVNDWLARDGALNVFVTCGAIFLAVCALAVPLWIFGKRTRSWIGRNDFLINFMRDTY